MVKMPAEYFYHICGNVLDRYSFTNHDRGVTFEKQWKLNLHIADSLKTYGFFRNACYFWNILVLSTLDVLICSILEAGSIKWCSGVISQCNELRPEKVQREFLRHLYLKKYGYYPFLFPSAFILGALGYVSLSTRKCVKHFWKLLKIYTMHVNI